MMIDRRAEEESLDTYHKIATESECLSDDLLVGSLLPDIVKAVLKSKTDQRFFWLD